MGVPAAGFEKAHLVTGFRESCRDHAPGRAGTYNDEVWLHDAPPAIGELPIASTAWKDGKPHAWTRMKY
ncbi:hypothetical protein MesoLj113c_63320 [Mesorhizobium sp. 113-3-9]|nr:hypothetical protein MesoLj113c_63320 [Mesorhizobium sp. 113-3-9]